MRFSQFLNCAKNLPENISVLLRGPHGIGKSQSVYQLAKHFKLDVVERRLSQMSEGDMIGLPKVDGDSTRFLPPDWYLDACRNPRMLFLDELNRATPEVMQAAFQIVLDRTLNGHKLHPETRVYAAINASSEYQVNEMDPALLDRFWVCDLEPNTEDWMTWAKTSGLVHEHITDFIQHNEKFLDSGAVDPGKISPSRRSYERLSDILSLANVVDKPEDSLFYELSLGMIGTEASIALQAHVKNLNRHITAEDILDNWEKVEARVQKLGQEKWNICIEKLDEWLKKNKISEEQTANFARFFNTIPLELCLVLWTRMLENGADDAITRHNACFTRKKEVIGRIFDALNRPFDNEVSKIASAFEEPADKPKKTRAKKIAVETK